MKIEGMLLVLQLALIALVLFLHDRGKTVSSLEEDNSRLMRLLSTIYVASPKTVEDAVTGIENDMEAQKKILKLID